MTKRITTRISFVLSICMIIACFSVSAYAAAPDSETITDPFEQIVESKNVEYSQNYVSNIIESETETTAILDVYNMIYNLVYNEDEDTFAYAYGGAYVNDDNLLVINYVGDLKDILEIIGDSINAYNDFVIFESVENSYASLYEAKKQLDEMMFIEFDMNKNDNEFFRSIIQYYIDEQANTIVKQIKYIF